ncbi:dsDNA nuclease domain-containing protein [Streptomyces werraensis]|uniref:dsDNA nuclease domain-containing protein n=1 Tax=Streptomyces werraensis TaxID=68284 RepID=UPI00343FD735
MGVVDVLANSVGDPEPFVHPIFQLRPGEDSGSETLGLFRYQAEVAAQACLAMLTEDVIDYVVCEWHEDFVIAFTNGEVELVSVKHSSRTQWTLADLCKDGGIAHLFDRWYACGRASNVRLRLTTNAPLSPAKDNASTLARMCGPDPELAVGRDAMARSLSQHLLKVRWKQPYDSIPEVLPELRKVGDIAAPQEFIDQVAAFIAVLEIDYKDVPSHRHITDINIRRLLEPAIESLQLDHVDVNASYRRIIERVEQANRSEGEQGQLAAYVADSSRVRYDTQILRRVASRTLYRQTILDEFVYRQATVPTYTRGQAPAIAPGGAALRKKLAQGQVPSDEAAYAEELRSAWYVTWSQRRSGLAGDAMDLENLRLEVVDTVFDCRAHAQSEVIDGGAYGQRMNQLIRQRLTPEVIDTTLPFKINKLHLRGLAYQLCDECHFYFSAPFDVSSGEAS